MARKNKVIPISRPRRLPKISTDAEITEEDIKSSRDRWRKDAPPEFRRLLDATVIPDPDAERAI